MTNNCREQSPSCPGLHIGTRTRAGRDRLGARLPYRETWVADHEARSLAGAAKSGDRIAVRQAVGLAHRCDLPQYPAVRVLFVNSARRLGGGLTSGLDLAAGLAGAGHAITIVCHPASAIHAQARADQRIEVVPLVMRSELNLWRALQLRGVIRRVRPDVILADRRKDVKFSFWARGFRRTPAIVHRHGAPSPLSDSPIYRYTWTRIQGIIVNSLAMAAELRGRTPWIARVPIHVIHNGKDLQRYRPRPGERAAMRAALGIGAAEYVACFHGVLQRRKHVSDLLRAAARSAPDEPIHLLIVGEGPDEEELRTAAAESGIRATFTGRRADVPELLCAADVAVHLSDAEGFSNSVVEALACGLPVIASHAHSHPEQIEDGVTGRLVPPGDLEALGSALAEFRDLSVRQRAGAAARRTAEARFGLGRMVAEYAEALGGVAGLAPD